MCLQLSPTFLNLHRCICINPNDKRAATLLRQKLTKSYSQPANVLHRETQDILLKNAIFDYMLDEDDRLEWYHPAIPRHILKATAISWKNQDAYIQRLYTRELDTAYGQVNLRCAPDIVLPDRVCDIVTYCYIGGYVRCAHMEQYMLHAFVTGKLCIQVLRVEIGDTSFSVSDISSNYVSFDKKTDFVPQLREDVSRFFDYLKAEGLFDLYVQQYSA